MATDCVEFEHYKNKKGYGVVRHKGKTELAHRVTYVKAQGLPIEAIKDMVILHSCDNPACIYPPHLSEGTPRENTLDSLVKGRHRELYGSQVGTSRLTEEQVLEIRAAKTSQIALAEQYGVAKQTISAIITRVSWRHI